MHTLKLVAVETPTCMFCKEKGIVNVPEEVLDRLANGEHIQYAWPYSTPDEREMLITGTHPDCWETMFSGSDCD